MGDSIYKCYRCNMNFKDADLAMLHKTLLNHSVTKIKAPLLVS